MKKKKKTNKPKWQKITRESFTRTLQGYERPDYTLDINGLPRNSIPTSDRIPGACVKRTLPKVKLPEGKTIGIAYNKGNYQVVDKTDFKTMGRKT
jgi:hypothetical protein|tara:strand:+ start:163 stop:447 length:285 start_codon:yes stop_codon:yes gene_type:complete